MRTELQFQVAIATKKAVAVERAAIASAMCRDCKRGDVPTYNADVHHYYHALGDGEEIGCSASVVHYRTRSEQ